MPRIFKRATMKKKPTAKIKPVQSLIKGIPTKKSSSKPPKFEGAVMKKKKRRS